MITLHTNHGDISIELDTENTPITAENFGIMYKTDIMKLRLHIAS